MKKSLLMLLLSVLSFSFSQAQDWYKAQWIWQQQDGPANGWVSFRKKVQVDDIPETVLAHIAVDSRFWLWVNGEIVVFEGGSSPEPSQAGAWNRENKVSPTNTLYETVVKNIQKKSIC